jgi:arylsulfatase A-like enzyme
MSLPISSLCSVRALFALAAEPRPNVVFIFADDQRADTIAALGNPVIKTPNLDRLVKRGVAFTRAYMQGGNQGATCVPSRAMLLPGRSLAQIDEAAEARPWPHAFGEAGSHLRRRQVA